MAYQDQVDALAKDGMFLQRNSQSSDQKRIIENNKDSQHAQSDQSTPVIASVRQREILQTTLVTEFLKTAALSEYRQGNLKRQNADDDNDVDYPLTITDPNWQWGNPTAIVTSSDRDKTVTLLYFTSTTLEWHRPDSVDVPRTITTTTTVTEGTVTNQPVTSLVDTSTLASTEARTSEEHEVSTVVETIIKTATAPASSSVAEPAATSVAAAEAKDKVETKHVVIIIAAIGVFALFLFMMAIVVPRLKRCYKRRKANNEVIELCQNYVSSQRNWDEENRNKDDHPTFAGPPVPATDTVAQRGPYDYPMRYATDPAAGFPAELHHQGSQHGSGGFQEPRAYHETPIPASSHDEYSRPVHGQQIYPAELPSNGTDVSART